MGRKRMKIMHLLPNLSNRGAERQFGCLVPALVHMVLRGF